MSLPTRSPRSAATGSTAPSVARPDVETTGPDTADREAALMIAHRLVDRQVVEAAVRVSERTAINPFAWGGSGLYSGPASTALLLRRCARVDLELTAWWSELRCGRLFGDMVRPDAYGRWREDGHQIEFFLEFDFGTEDLGKLGRKLHGYEKLATATGITTPVLVWLPSNRRETTARRALADALFQLDRPALVPVATSASDVAGVAGENNPAVGRWLPVSGPSSRRPGRLRLAELAQLWPHADPPAAAPSSTSLPAQQAPAELAAPDPLPPSPPTSRFRR